MSMSRLGGNTKFPKHRSIGTPHQYYMLPKVHPVVLTAEQSRNIDE